MPSFVYTFFYSQFLLHYMKKSVIVCIVRNALSFVAFQEVNSAHALFYQRKYLRVDWNYSGSVFCLRASHYNIALIYMNVFRFETQEFFNTKSCPQNEVQCPSCRSFRQCGDECPLLCQRQKRGSEKYKMEGIWIVIKCKKSNC